MCVCVLYMITYVLLNHVDISKNFKCLYNMYSINKIHFNAQIFKLKHSIKAMCVSLHDSYGWREIEDKKKEGQS